MKGVKAVRRERRNGKWVYVSGGAGGSKETVFEIGKEYSVEGPPVLCENGFHFFRERDLCFGVDFYDEGNGFVEIEAMGRVVCDAFKCVTSKIKIIRYIPKKEWMRATGGAGRYNSGDYNSGRYNSGDCNSGNCNSGNYNSGDRNSGNCNSGYYNSGHCNFGDYNSGDHNSGHYNSGDYNSGDFNSGDFNSGAHNSGHYNSGDGYRNFFCTKTRYFLFDTEVPRQVIDKVMRIDMMSWFSLDGRTYKEAWAECPADILDAFREIPEFQTDTAKRKFKEITGLSL